MGNYQKAVEKQKETSSEVPRTPSDKPKRTKQIRLTEETYLKLSKMGDLTEDYEDVVARLVEFWEEHHRDG